MSKTRECPNCGSEMDYCGGREDASFDWVCQNVECRATINDHPFLRSAKAKISDVYMREDVFIPNYFSYKAIFDDEEENPCDEIDLFIGKGSGGFTVPRKTIDYFVEAIKKDVPVDFVQMRVNEGELRVRIVIDRKKEKPVMNVDREYVEVDSHGE